MRQTTRLGFRRGEHSHRNMGKSGHEATIPLLAAGYGESLRSEAEEWVSGTAQVMFAYVLSWLVARV